MTVTLPPPVHHYRVLFTDGRTVDFTAWQDSSDVRKLMLDHATATGSHKDVGIAGMVALDVGVLL